jgi:hypothetical protein
MKKGFYYRKSLEYSTKNHDIHTNGFNKVKYSLGLLDIANFNKGLTLSQFYQ